MNRLLEQASKNRFGKVTKAAEIVVVETTPKKAQNKNHKLNGRVPQISDRTNISQKAIDQITEARVSQLLDSFHVPNNQLSLLHKKIVDLVRSSVSEALERQATPDALSPSGDVASLPVQAPEIYGGLRGPETPPEFVKRVYGPWLGQGLDRAHIKHLDPKLYTAIDNWTRKPGNEWPADVDLPTRAEQNQRILNGGEAAIRQHLGKFTGAELLREAARLQAVGHYRK